MKIHTIQLICFFAVLCFTACPQNPSLPPDFSILSPKQTGIYFDDESIEFSLDKALEPVVWVSSIDGELGKQHQLATNLTAGKHTITARIGAISKSLEIIVNPRESANEKYRRFHVRNLPCTCRFSGTGFLPYIAALDGSAEMLNIQQTSFDATQRNISEAFDDLNDFSKQKMFRCGDDRDLSRFSSYASSTYLRSAAPPPDTDEKEFFIINTVSQSQEAHRLDFRRYYSSTKIEIWVPKETEPKTNEAITKCIEELEKRILIRVTDIWGEAADINGDKKIAIVFSPTINREKAAFGFFYPLDFFPNNTDKKSDNYNPFSNHADIVYAGIPSIDPKNNYYYKTIASTVGHELTHAITFTNKTYNPWKTEQKPLRRTEIFLDEGLSHLCENLIGDSLSSKNIVFFSNFLKRTADYSFCKADATGKLDSVGQRGAMTLFLSWCFWKKGGMDWDETEPVRVIDKGGIAFLRNLGSSSDLGWEAIGNAFGGTTTDKLFLEMLDDLRVLCNKSDTVSYKKDKLTEEPAEFLPCMGKLDIPEQETSITIGRPQPNITQSLGIRKLLPYSFAFIDKTIIPNTVDRVGIIFKGTRTTGNVRFCLIKGDD